MVNKQRSEMMSLEQDTENLRINKVRDVTVRKRGRMNRGVRWNVPGITHTSAT